MLEVLQQTIGGAVCAAGLALVLGGALGLLRFPDVYTRLHGVNVADAAGAAITLVGLAMLSGDGALTLRLLALAALTAALGPVIAHLVASAAHAGGLAPIAGPYRAPRPGERREPRS